MVSRIVIYSLFTDKWFQLLLSKLNSSISTQLSGFKYSLSRLILFNIKLYSQQKIEQFYLTSIWTLTGTTTPDQSRHESNSTE